MTEFQEIVKNLQEFIGDEIIKECLQNKSMTVYWGTAPTGRPHIAYFLAMTKLADFLRSNCHVTVLFANLHAYLDNIKAPWNLLNKRTEYYEVLIKGMLKALKVPLDKLRFVRGTDYQFDENYTRSVYEIISVTSVRDAVKAGCEVVKQVNDPLMCSIIYPLLQALDEEYLGVDAQLGGVDQRKIFMYAEKYLPGLAMAKRAHLMNPMIPGLTGGKMSASEADSKIDLLDSAETVHEKLTGAANSVGGTATENGVLAFMKYVLIPSRDLLDADAQVALAQWSSYEELEAAVASGDCSMTTLTPVVELGLTSLMGGLRSEFEDRPGLIEEAYPSNEQEEETDNSIDSRRSITNHTDCLDALLELLPGASHDPSKYPDVGSGPSIMWSCRVTGDPHVGYVVPLQLLASLSRHGWRVTVLLEDVGALLHSPHNANRPTDWDQMRQRALIYRDVLTRLLADRLQADMSMVQIVLGSEFQLSKKYALMLYQSLSRVSHSMCSSLYEQQQTPMAGDIIGGQEDIGLIEETRLSSLVYVCMRVIDSLYLRPTVRLCMDSELHRLFAAKLSTDMSMQTVLPVTLSHQTLLALDGTGPMRSPRLAPATAPKDTSSLSLLDDKAALSRKLKKAFCDPSEDGLKPGLDPCLEMVAHVLLPWLGRFTVPRTPENGGEMLYTDVDSLRSDMYSDLMHPGDVKSAVATILAEEFSHPDGCAMTMEQKKPGGGKKKNQGKKQQTNPNVLDMRVAQVESVQWERGLFSVCLRSGMDLVETRGRSGLLGRLRPGSSISVLLASGQVLGVLCDRNGDPLRLVAGQAQLPRVRFAAHIALLPNKKVTEAAEAMRIIDEGFLILRNNQICWDEAGSGLSCECNFTDGPIRLCALE